MTDHLEELPEIEAQAAAVAQRVPLIAITDQASFDLATEDRRDIKRRLARIAELMDDICDSAHKAWKTAVAKRDGLRAPFLEADKAYSRAQGAYEEGQTRIRREAEETTRRERERLETEERDRVAAESARLRREAEERLFAEAVEAESVGDTPTVVRLLETPIETPLVEARPVAAPVVQLVAKPVARGVSFRSDWDFVIVDEASIPREYLIPDHVKIRKAVKAMRGETAIPGVKATETRIAVQRQG
jgi:hypothetical protein